jgi:hypothetical protein
MVLEVDPDRHEPPCVPIGNAVAVAADVYEAVPGHVPRLSIGRVIADRGEGGERRRLPHEPRGHYFLNGAVDAGIGLVCSAAA